jgi:hypothetical protein
MRSAVGRRGAGGLRMSLVESLFRRTRQDLFVCRRMGLSVSKGRKRWEGESTCLSLCLLYEVEVEVDGRRDPSSCTHARRGLGGV